MKFGLWATAFIVLAGATLLAVAGVAALDASHADVNETVASEPPVTSMGEDVQSALVTALPWLAAGTSVPLGIAGLYGMFRFSSSSGGRRGGRR
jgi:hypothetical protein